MKTLLLSLLALLSFSSVASAELVPVFFEQGNNLTTGVGRRVTFDDNCALSPSNYAGGCYIAPSKFAIINCVDSNNPLSHRNRKRDSVSAIGSYLRSQQIDAWNWNVPNSECDDVTFDGGILRVRMVGTNTAFLGTDYIMDKTGRSPGGFSVWTEADVELSKIVAQGVAFIRGGVAAENHIWNQVQHAVLRLVGAQDTLPNTTSCTSQNVSSVNLCSISDDVDDLLRQYWYFTPRD